MKTVSKLSLASVFVIMAASFVPALPAIAKTKCQKSCTALKSGCISRGGNRAACSAGYAKCLKTGVYAGMPSGQTHSNICRR